MTWIIGHILAVGIGLSLGLIGGGGSILAVPILVYVMGLEAKVAIAMSLAVVGIVSLIGVIPHWRQGNVNFKTAAIFTPAAMLGAFLGARLAALPFITGTIQLICFGIVMVLASVLMIRSSSPKAPNQEPTVEHQSPVPHSHQRQWIAIPLEGLGVGILTGFVGVGGGFAIIPALVLLGDLPMKEAIGTSLLIIAFKSAAGFAGYLNQVTLDWTLMLTFTLAASFGTVAGALLTQRIEAKYLQKGFGYFVLIVAIFILIKR
ncbi:MAG: sulfite exporter TauE/SafE family protein [Thermosynechococcaceae cyanobacterium]